MGACYTRLCGLWCGPKRETGSDDDDCAINTSKLRWTAKSPISRDEWQAMNDDFWHSASATGGKEEIWNALQSVCAALDDKKLVNSILEAAQISIPTGNITEGAYDALGNQYIIPAHCLVPPDNLRDAAAVAAAASPIPAKKKCRSCNTDDCGAIDVFCRFSTGVDKELKISKSMTVESLRKVLLQYCPANSKIAVVIAGRRLQDSETLCGVQFYSRPIIQLLVTSLDCPK